MPWGPLATVISRHAKSMKRSIPTFPTQIGEKNVLQYFKRNRGKQMKPTRVIKKIVEQLKETGIIKYNKDFLAYIGADTTTKEIKSLSDYMRRDGEVRDRIFLKKIEDKLGWGKEIWQRSDVYQIEQINKAIEHILDLQNLPDESALDVSDIIQSKSIITQEQLDKLEQFSNTLSNQEAETMIDTFLKEGFLEKSVKNQAFLVELATLTYQKGLYAIIIEFILPNLYRRYQLLPEVQKIEAHSLGSLGRYEDAKHILEVLSHHKTIENINLKTAALSTNHKRALMNSKDSVDSDALYALISGYYELHALNGIYSYYTGINLLYMVILGQLLFSADTRFVDIDTEEIYKRSKPSLAKDKTHDPYYVVMSDFEFQLLLRRQGVIEKIESFLANEEPHPSLVERTLRQMKLFIQNIEHTNSSLVLLFEKAVALLESYIHISNTSKK